MHHYLTITPLANHTPCTYSIGAAMSSARRMWAAIVVLTTVGGRAAEPMPLWGSLPWNSTYNPGPPFPGGGVSIWGSWFGCHNCGGITLLSRVWPIIGCDNESSPRYIDEACKARGWPADGRSHGYCKYVSGGQPCDSGHSQYARHFGFGMACDGDWNPEKGAASLWAANEQGRVEPGTSESPRDYVYPVEADCSQTADPPSCHLQLAFMNVTGVADEHVPMEWLNRQGGTWLHGGADTCWTAVMDVLNLLDRDDMLDHATQPPTAQPTRFASQPPTRSPVSSSPTRNAQFDAVCPSPPEPAPEPDPGQNNDGSGHDEQQDTEGTWAGTVTFVDAQLETSDEPLNLTVGKGTASLAWTFTVDGVGRQCRTQNQAVLLWTVDTRGVATVQPTSNESTFYTFRGSLDDVGLSISGLVYRPPFNDSELVGAVGCFTVHKMDTSADLPSSNCSVADVSLLTACDYGAAWQGRAGSYCAPSFTNRWTCKEYHCESNRMQMPVSLLNFCRSKQNGKLSDTGFCNHDRCGGSFGCPKLQSIPRGFRVDAELIDLSKNAITEVTTGPFDNAIHLLALFLNDNLITSVQTGSLGALANLTILWIFGNEVRRFPSDVDNFPFMQRMRRGVDWLWTCTDRAGPLVCDPGSCGSHGDRIVVPGHERMGPGRVGPNYFSFEFGHSHSCPYFDLADHVTYRIPGLNICVNQSLSCTACDDSIGGEVDAEGIVLPRTAFDITEDGYYLCSVAHIPTIAPTVIPSGSPTTTPTSSPTFSQPTAHPSASPSTTPTSSVPTTSPTFSPSATPSKRLITSTPSAGPSTSPTASPLPDPCNVYKCSASCTKITAVVTTGSTLAHTLFCGWDTDRQSAFYMTCRQGEQTTAGVRKDRLGDCSGVVINDDDDDTHVITNDHRSMLSSSAIATIVASVLVLVAIVSVGTYRHITTHSARQLSIRAEVFDEAGSWDFFLSHTQRSGHATTLASDLHADFKDLGFSSWLDVKMDDRSESGMKEGVENCSVVIAILTLPCVNPDRPDDPLDSNAYFSRPFCIQELRWAREAGIPIQPVIRSTDKQRIGDPRDRRAH